jgi:hypothetical protein
MDHRMDMYPSSQPPLTIVSTTSEPVAIIVGVEKEKFFVHYRLLESSSEYFRKVLSAEQEDLTFRVVKLLDADANAFQTYSKWLYTGRFHLSSGPDTHVSESSPTYPHWDEVADCYSLSVLLQAPDFGDAIIDAFIHLMRIYNTSPIGLAMWIYPRTTKGSPHRTLCRDIVVRTWDRESFDRLWKQDFPREFLENVFAEVSLKLDHVVKRYAIAEFLESKSPCTYHEHEQLNLPCYKSNFADDKSSANQREVGTQTQKVVILDEGVKLKRGPGRPKASGVGGKK